MMPTRLNLLSPAKQSHLLIMMYGQYSRHLLEHLFLVIAVSGIILLGGQWVLDLHFLALASDLTSLSNKQSAKNKDIKATNAILNQTAAIQEQYTLWTPLIQEIAKAVPARVTLVSLTMDKPGKTLSFSGAAATRENLLLFEKNLEALPEIAEVTIPLSDLIPRKDLQFSFTASLK